MNGRVYDPVLARFLSADPFVDGVTDSQGFNRYSYVSNNPLGATDPTGYLKLWKDVLGPIVQYIAAQYGMIPAADVGYTINGSKGAIQGAASSLGMFLGGNVGYGFSSGFSGSLLNGGSIGEAFKSGFIGGAQAYVAGKIGDTFGPPGTWQNELARATAHGTLGGAVEEAQGGEFRHGFYAGFAGSEVGSVVGSGPLGKIGGPAGIALRTAIAAVAGGTAAELGGGKFANGALTAAFQHLFNHEGGNIRALMKQRQQLLNDMRALDEDIATGEYVSLSHKLATDIVEWVGVGKAVAGGAKLAKGIWGLLRQMSVRGYNYPAQQVINSSLAGEAAWKVVDHIVDEGAKKAGQGALLWSTGQAASFGDALNHGEGTLKQAYLVRQQLEFQLKLLNQQIQSGIAQQQLQEAIGRLK